MKNRIVENIIRVFVLGIAAIALVAFSPVGVAPKDEIHWQKDFKLDWEHFKGKPDRFSSMDALTESGISFSWNCDWRGFKIIAYAIFVPTGSWVKNPTDGLLLHERGHFDITEIHARKIRKFFAQHPDPCRLGKTGIDNSAKQFIAANYALQNEYDEATNHGQNTRMQREWLGKISKQLSELEAYGE